MHRVSTAEQGHSGLGLEAQRASVQAFVASHGWALVAGNEDIASGKDDRRPGFQAALTRCRQLGAVLVAARLDRIAQSPARLKGCLRFGACQHGFRRVATALTLDTFYPCNTVERRSPATLLSGGAMPAGNLLYWALVALVVALVAAALGFGGIAGTAAGIAKILFWIFLVIFLVVLVMNFLGSRRGPTV